MKIFILSCIVSGAFRFGHFQEFSNTSIQFIFHKPDTFTETVYMSITVLWLRFSRSFFFFFFNFQVEIELRDDTRWTGYMVWNETNTNINFI